MRFIFPLCALLASMGVNSSPVAQKDPVSEMWRARTSFTGNLLYELDHRARGKNFLVSTIGLHSALTTLMVGSKGATFDQLFEQLG